MSELGLKLLIKSVIDFIRSNKKLDQAQLFP
jgi:hypothetical protein